MRPRRLAGPARARRPTRRRRCSSTPARTGSTRTARRPRSRPTACCCGRTPSTTTSRSDVLQAAVEVLEDAGYRVEIPPRPLCCGRPLYDWGMLDTAERLWRQTLATLRPWIRAGVPVVGLEPSCVAAFRDELVNLFPNDDDARRLSEQTLLFSEFLERQRYQPPPLDLRAQVHGHCHHNVGPRDGRRGRAAEADGRRARGARLGVLRHGRRLRLLRRSLRGLDARRGAGAAARRPRPAARDACW